jgi:hypothetical protein
MSFCLGTFLRQGDASIDGTMLSSLITGVTTIFESLAILGL